MPGEVDVGANASGGGGACAPGAGLPAEVAAQLAGGESGRQSLVEQVHKEAVQAEERAEKATDAAAEADEKAAAKREVSNTQRRGVSGYRRPVSQAMKAVGSLAETGLKPLGEVAAGEPAMKANSLGGVLPVGKPRGSRARNPA